VEYDSWIISAQNTKWMDDALKQTNVRSQVLNAFSIFRKGVKFKKAPSPRILGRLIQGLGRQHEVEKAQEVYHVAQETYKCLAHDQAELRDAWICVEDSMIIALAHAGDIDNAHIHRLRLIEQGASPSADAYGALILSVKDTTDDASNALLLFNEALSSNIKMNIYLYNNIISKFAKARKADAALELFQRMKVDGVKPTSITYGALIGACARVGDVQSSETLFEEMCGHENFKARVPPFNTMMQLYTMTKPNRERALWFYEKMREVGVRPTAHTYKVRSFFL
jgi:pentatricopeptide repeat protein